MHITVTGHEGNEWQLEIELSLAEHAEITKQIEAIEKRAVYLDDRIKGTIKGR